MLIRKLKLDAPRGQPDVRALADDVELFIGETGSDALAIRNGDVSDVPLETSVHLVFSSGDVGCAGGDWLFHVGLWTPDDFRDEFLAWYRVEHLPILLESPLWDGCRFVEERVSNGCQFYAMHQLSDTAALDSDHRKLSRSTAWFHRLKANKWFDGGFVRTLYRRAPSGTRMSDQQGS